MPGTPQPVGANGPLPVVWNQLFQMVRAHSQGLAALVAGATQGNLIDGVGNTVEVAGTNLNQTVTIGAQLQAGPPTVQAGVRVATGLTGAGRAKQANLATGTITLTAGSTAATLAAAGTFANGMVIGAANVTDPSSGVATPAITPGTTISSGGGTTTLTLSQAAAETGSALYCAACNFTQLA